jgi:hypothetical protein
LADSLLDVLEGYLAIVMSVSGSFDELDYGIYGTKEKLDWGSSKCNGSVWISQRMETGQQQLVSMFRK